jgi:predicted phage tail protein
MADKKELQKLVREVSEEFRTMESAFQDLSMEVVSLRQKIESLKYLVKIENQSKSENEGI